MCNIVKEQSKKRLEGILLRLRFDTKLHRHRNTEPHTYSGHTHRDGVSEPSRMHKLCIVHITRLANAIPGLRIRHYNHRLNATNKNQTQTTVEEGPHIFIGHRYRDGVSEPSRMHKMGFRA